MFSLSFSFLISSTIAGDVDPHRAEADASAAAGAEGLAELVVIVLELVHDPVAVAFGLPVAGVVAGGMVGELPETAGIPVLAPLAAFLRPLVNDVETVAGRADKGTGAAADTAGGDGVPGRVFEVLVQPGLDLFQIEFLHLRHGQGEGFAVIWARRTGRCGCSAAAPPFPIGIRSIAATLQRGQEEVRPFVSSGERPTAVQKQASSAVVQARPMTVVFFLRSRKNWSL